MISRTRQSFLLGIFFVILGTLHECSGEVPHYHAAGILPYHIDATGTVQILVGIGASHAGQSHDLNHHNQISDFGGRKDPEDNNNPTMTAAREGCEELTFIFDHNTQFKHILKERNKHGHHFDITKANSASYALLCKKLNKPNCLSTYSNGYIMHFVKLPHKTTQKDLSSEFLERKKQYENHLPHCWNETNNITWMNIDHIFDAIDKRPSQEQSIYIGQYCLYEPFVQSLLAARSTGIIEQIKK